MTHKLSKVDTDKGSFIVIFSDGKINGEMQFVHVVLGEGKNTLTIKAQKSIHKVMLHKNKKLTHQNSYIDWMTPEDTDLLKRNRLAKTNTRCWFLADRSGVHELHIS